MTHLRRAPALTLLAAFLLMLAVTPGTALAHALLLRSDPVADAVLKSSPATVHLWFSEDLNGAASRIVVWDRSRHDETIGPATVVPGQPRQMVARLKHLTPGSYLVLWTSVSAADGHLLRGSFLFSVGHRGPGPSLSGVTLGNGQSFPDVPGMISLLAHWIELLAAVVWTGTVAFSALVFGPLRSRVTPQGLDREYAAVRRVVWIGIPIMMLASTILIVMNAYGIDGNSWNGLLSRSTLLGVFADQYGQLWVARQVLALVALLLAFMISRSAGPDARAEFAGALTVMGAVYLYAFSASGHAASAAIGVLPGSHEELFSISVFVDWLHFLSDAAWLGGQVTIVLVLIPALLTRATSVHTVTFLDTLNRFSPAAYASIALFTVSGAFNGKVHIFSWYAFFNSIYGRTLIVKMLLIAAMMLVSAYTVFRLRPRIKRQLAEGESAPASAGIERLRRWLHVNPLLGAGVLLATSVMFYYPVPAGFAPAGPSAYATRSGDLVASLTIKPDASGPNTITVTLRRPNGALVRQAHVAVLTTMLDMEMGTGLASLSERAPGVFSGSTDLGMGGHWRLQILVYAPSSSGVSLTRLSVDVQVGT